MKDAAPPTAAAPSCNRLAAGLRELRARTGLSMAALAERTAYSKSSWERYLNGKQLAPRQAVEVLCAMAGEPPGRLMALWELADGEWSGRAGSAPDPVAAPAVARPDDGGLGDDGPGDGRSVRSAEPGQARRGHSRLRGWAGPRGWAVVAAAVCVVAVAAAVWVAVLPNTGSNGSTARVPSTAPPPPGCRGQGCVGKDPGLMGCGMPSRVRALGPPLRTSTGARLEFRYSAACAAAWARMWHSHIGDVIEVSSGGEWRRAEVTDTYDTQEYVFTPMVDGTDRTKLRVCFEPGGGGTRECFTPGG
ncbi:helix-turn-helix domain-containing protein [Streptomyces malaysiensis]|uniref:XRE family transcriptional regulator n=1 Tax=Streptomyces malaysiensis subsp. samsunensis TaxID=459658 RepID=A0A9X2LV84_STRMQ|nr:XRE family transcriptional regulator [Streptomyces samsunensis]MCQ8830091.1 XRE family transcriptional regulator [Streptomyces samsunensis]